MTTTLDVPSSRTTTRSDQSPATLDLPIRRSDELGLATADCATPDPCQMMCWSVQVITSDSVVPPMSTLTATREPSQENPQTRPGTVTSSFPVGISRIVVSPLNTPLSAR